MKSSRVLYFSGINLNPENIKILRNKFFLTKLHKLSDVNKLNNKCINQIVAIYCDQKFFYDKNFLIKFNNIKFLISSTTSTDFIDKNFCTKKKIKIISLENDKKFLKKITPTAEHTLGLILMISRNYYSAIKFVNKGIFNRRPFGGFKMLSKSTLGIIGYGRLGKLLNKISKNIFKKIYKADIIDGQVTYKKNLKKIFENCDFISLHINAKKNYEFFDQKNLPKITKKFFLINTSRGEVINEKFVMKLIKKKIIKGYATDVIKNEFSNNFQLKKNIFFKNRNKYNILITPHIGGSTIDAWSLTEKRVISKLLKKF